jgi:HK97 family phage portal protein
MFQWANRFFERKSSTISAPAPWLFELFGATVTAAGKNISPQSALRSPAVACAVRVVTEAVGQLPVHVYRRGLEGARDRDIDHPAHALLHDQANDWTSASEFRTQITTDALLHGNGFAYVNRVGGRPFELLRLSPTAVSVTADEATGEPIYKLAQQGGQRVLARADVLHIRTSLSHDGINGESPIKLAREAIALSLAMEEHASRLFGSGARPSGTLETEKQLNEVGIANVKKVIDAQHSGPGRAGGTIVLPEGLKFNPLTFKSVDLQFLELRKYAVDEIARAFRVPPHMLYELGRATWGNAEELGAAFVTFSLMYWIKAWEGAIRRTLFSEDERKQYFAEFLVDDLLRADFAKRSEGISKLIAARVFNPNDGRKLLNYPPYEGGDEFVNPNIAPAPTAGSRT